MADNADLPELPELPEQFDISVEESGLRLNLGAPQAEEAEDVVAREVTPEDLAALREVQQQLEERWGETQIDPTLERVEYVMDLLGSPQRSFKAIHVAGTNGKTSTTRMIESLLRSLGHRVCLLYTSDAADDIL